MNRVACPARRAPPPDCAQMAQGCALQRRAKENDEIVFAGQRVAARRCSRSANCIEVRIRAVPRARPRQLPRPASNLQNSRALRGSLMLARIDDVQPRAVVPDGGTNLPGDQRILLGRIVADQQKRRRAAPDRAMVANAALGICQYVPPSVGDQAGVIGGAVVIDVVRARWTRARCAPAGNFLRWWCGSSRRSRWHPRRSALRTSASRAAICSERIFPGCRLRALPLRRTSG